MRVRKTAPASILRGLLHLTPPRLMPSASERAMPGRPHRGRDTDHAMPARKQRPSRYLHAAALASALLLLHRLRQPPPPPRPAPHASSPRRPAPILAATTRGGIGNQLYYLAEALHLARRTDATLILPSIPPRGFPDSNLSHPEVSAADLFDVSKLSSIARVVAHMPARCAGTFDHIFLARRGGREGPIGSRVLQAACFLAVPPRAPEEPIWRCARRVIANARVTHFSLPLSKTPNDALMRALRSSDGCVLLDGHSFDRAGMAAHELLHSYLHYVAPAPRVKQLAAKYMRKGMAVVHVRFDENECRNARDGMVCVRKRLSSGKTDTVTWVPVAQFAEAVVGAMDEAGAESVYLALSPYVPARIAAGLTDAFTARVDVQRRVDQEVGHTVHNFVEREIAVNAQLFIADFASTWSGTVYYKRRTLGRGTLWSCRLVGVCTDLGYYGRTGLLKRPAQLEREV